MSYKTTAPLSDGDKAAIRLIGMTITGDEDIDVTKAKQIVVTPTSICRGSAADWKERLSFEVDRDIGGIHFYDFDGLIEAANAAGYHLGYDVRPERDWDVALPDGVLKYIPSIDTSGPGPYHRRKNIMQAVTLDFVYDRMGADEDLPLTDLETKSVKRTIGRIFGDLKMMPPVVGKAIDDAHASWLIRHQARIDQKAKDDADQAAARAVTTTIASYGYRFASNETTALAVPHKKAVMLSNGLCRRVPEGEWPVDWTRWGEAGDVVIVASVWGKKELRVVRPASLEQVKQDGLPVLKATMGQGGTPTFTYCLVDPQYLAQQIAVSPTIMVFPYRSKDISTVVEFNSLTYRPTRGTSYISGIFNADNTLADLLKRAPVLKLATLKTRMFSDQDHQAQLLANDAYTENLYIWVDRLAEEAGISLHDLLNFESTTMAMTGRAVDPSIHAQVEALTSQKPNYYAKYVTLRDKIAVDRWGTIHGLTIESRCTMEAAKWAGYGSGVAVREGATQEQIDAAGLKKLAAYPTTGAKIPAAPVRLALPDREALNEAYSAERDKPDRDPSNMVDFGCYNYMRAIGWVIAAKYHDRIANLINQAGEDTGVPAFVIRLRLNRLGTLLNFIGGRYNSLPSDVVGLILKGILAAACNGKLAIPKWTTARRKPGAKGEPDKVLREVNTWLPEAVRVKVAAATDPAIALSLVARAVRDIVVSNNAAAEAMGKKPAVTSKVWLFSESEELASKKLTHEADEAMEDAFDCAGSSVTRATGTGALTVSAVLPP